MGGSGLTGLTVLKSTGSEFRGFLRDGYTTLAETSDRILATSLDTRWLHTGDTGTLDNPNEVFHATDRPYGVIEASVVREGAPDAALAWSAGA